MLITLNPVWHEMAWISIYAIINNVCIKYGLLHYLDCRLDFRPIAFSSDNLHNITCSLPQQSMHDLYFVQQTECEQDPFLMQGVIAPA